MAPSKAPVSWDDDESGSDSTTPSSPPAPAVNVRRGKFDDEEDEDVLESWDAAEDSEEEREKAKKAAEAKAKADALAKANQKPKSQRIEEKRNERLRQKAENLDLEDSEDDEATRREQQRQAEKDGDFAAAEDLFGGVGGVPESRSKAAKAVTVQASDAPEDKVDLAKLSIFSPNTALQFNKLREVLVPLLNQNGKKPHYELFMKEFTKQIVRDLNSEQVKKLASGLTTISNEKLKEEKAAEKGGKKTKAAKTKTSLNASRNLASMADTGAYDDDGLDDGDFM
ncbi:hypothetical protein DOTSEDRAFT_91981 [Dothistroma septosporum NZE10]|uniref:Eukaryotic translation initiation factor 3 subunit J n=1 Tax=Dothistroma septosporum (strain NZE10 / CBS 128990) TaxID=675120 RepID=M2Y343_DOTSN|nr:hypothetical protein DOTSEDRAFT_91981 [Dothistroma septosporum NZE10]